MRIGNAFARVMDTGAGRRSVFIEEEVDEWTPEEWWSRAKTGSEKGRRREGNTYSTSIITVPFSISSSSPPHLPSISLDAAGRGSVPG
jgi:hypothetical protein